MAKLNKNALTSLETLKESLQSYGTIPVKPSDPEGYDLDLPEVENFLAQLINSISSSVETYTERSLGQQTYIENVTTMYGNTLKMENYPITEIKSIKLFNGGEIDVDQMMFFNDYRNMQDGIIDGGGMLPTNASIVGVGRHPMKARPTARVEYTAGYVLPKDATEDNPATLPADLESLVTEACLKGFVDRVKGKSTDNLLELTTGNVKHAYSSPVTAELAKYGAFTKAEQKVLNSYKRNEGLFSV